MDPTYQPADSRRAKKVNPLRRRNKRRILLAVLGILILFRILLPYIVLKYVNNKLAEMEGYNGHVEDIDIFLYRGAYAIKDIKIVKIREQNSRMDTIPFFSSPDVDLSIEWKSLFNGRIVGEIYFEKPVVNFLNTIKKDTNLSDDTADFRQLIKDLMPITVNHFEVERGEIHYIDPYANPSLNIFMYDIRVVAANLSNVKRKDELLPANLKASGAIHGGSFDLVIDMDALAKRPTFDLEAELVNLNMVNINPMLQAYANFDVKKGHFSVYSEFAGKSGDFAGYAKPIVKDLDVVQWEKEEGDLKQIAWETLVGVTAEVFQNQPKEQFATKVYIEGKFNDPNVNIWRAITYVLRNAFWQALKPSIEGTININQLYEPQKKTLLEKLFSNDKEAPETKN